MGTLASTFVPWLNTIEPVGFPGAVDLTDAFREKLELDGAGFRELVKVKLLAALVIVWLMTAELPS